MLYGIILINLWLNLVIKISPVKGRNKGLMIFKTKVFLQIALTFGVAVP